MIKHFSLPGYWNHFFEIVALINYRNKYPDFFYKDRIFDNAYGCPPTLCWNGGRAITIPNDILTYDTVFNYYQSIPNFHLRHVFTNMMIDDNIINDPLCNTVINKYYNKNDYIIIHNALLHKHLLSFIPPERFIYSTTLGIKDINLVNQYSKDNIYVLYYMYNNDNKYLAQLQYPHNIEIICAEQCIDNCPNRTNHYIALSKAAANIPLNENESTACPFKEKPLVLEQAVEDYLKSFKHAVNNDRIEELSSLGINDFKLSGRERPTALFFIFALYYLMYPQYREQAQKELIVETEKLKFKYKLTGQV